VRPASARRLLIKPHPLKADAWPLISLSAYQRVPSPKSLAWAGPYASRGTPSTPTSTQAEPATHPTEAINGHYRSRQTHRQRLPHPHQLPAPNTPHHMRPRRLHPNPTMKSSLVAPLPRILMDASFRISQAIYFCFHFIWFGRNVTDLLTLIVSPCPG